jgi:hypothetical protein
MQKDMQSVEHTVAALAERGWVYVCGADCSLKMRGRGLRLVGLEWDHGQTKGASV